MSSINSTAETLYEVAFELVQGERYEEAKDPAWRGLEEALRAEDPTQSQLSQTAIKCRLVLNRCKVPLNQIDSKIEEIRNSLRGTVQTAE